MAWKNVTSYSFGFGQADKKFWVYYTLDGATSATQIFLTATQFTALAQAFGSAASITFETSGKYFATAPRNL
jgi:hypothetical protein